MQVEQIVFEDAITTEQKTVFRNEKSRQKRSICEVA